MNAMAGTLIVLPAFNEEESVAAVVREVNATIPGVTCLVVDDGSKDRTAVVAEEAGAIVVSLPYNLGVGAAMRVGFRYALDNGFRNVVQVDADGQHDPASVRELVAGLDEADLVLGARFAGEGEYRASFLRRAAMRMLAIVLTGVTGTRLTDATSGFKASGPKAVRLFAEHYPAEYLGDTVEALVIASRARCVVRQVPVAMRPRSGGRPSHNPVKSAVYLARAMMALVFALTRSRAQFAVREVAP